VTDDAEDFDAFYAATATRVIAHVAAMVGSRSDAEDAAAEAYLKAWDRWAKVRRYDNPEAWVRTVAYRHAVSAWRKAVNRLRAHHRDAAGESDTAGLDPDHVAIVEALRRIPADQRRVIVLHHLVGLSVAEISAETGAPTGTITSWLARGRRAMAEQLSEGDVSRGYRDVR
jgi:RNA polymerase sigma-70 factor (ECF subfamily)